MATMEGWLQVPAERNLMGRAGTWKSRYVRFGSYSPTSPTSAISPIRPTTATGGGVVVGSGGIGAPTKLPHTVPEQKPVMEPISNAAESQIWLAIYKQRNDAEPVARYPLTAIASCYIGDIAPRHNKKKSIVLPTLIVNLRAEIQLSSKSFRRRSHDVPTREGAKRERAGREILYFRPAPDNVVAIETWAREIQSYLIPSSADSNTAVAIESAFRAKFSDLDLDAPTSPSLFFINGEPSTALLSPSIRSRASNLSSIDSDDKSVRSAASELPAYRTGDEISPRSSGIDGRPPLHVVTKMRHTIGADSQEDYFVNTPVVAPARRETILDRFFSSTAPSSPNFPPDPTPMNSIARFEALIRDIESGRDLEPRNLHPDLRAHPKRIPSPTQRALEYVSTGLLLNHLDHDEAPPDADPATNPHLSVGTFSRGLSRQASEASLGTTASMAGSHVETNLGVSNCKRHSMADFSAMRLATTPPLFHLAGERRGSHSDVPRIAEACEDGGGNGGGGGGSSGHGRNEFGSHPRVARPLFREFSF